ncbi:MAG: GumC family protein, partial [Gammaproteobacteria bacterium]
MNKPASIPPELVPAEGRYHGWPPSTLNLTQEETPEFVEHWRAIMLDKWTILALTVLVTVIAYVAVSQMAPVYQSSATVLIDSDRPNLVPIGDAYNSAVTYYKEYFQTQAEVFKSREVARRVVSKLELTEHPEFDPRQRSPSALENWMNEHLPALAASYWKPVAALDKATLEAQVLKRFADGLSIEPVRLSQLVKVTFEAHNATLAAAVANATAEAYIQADLDALYRTSEKGEQLIYQQLADLKAKLDASERALQAYRDREGMLDNKSTVLSGAGRQLDELTGKLVEARLRLSEAEQAHNQVSAGEATNYESVPAVVKSESVQRAKEIEAEAERKVAEVSQRFGPKHQKFLAASSDLSAARANTRRQIQNLAASVGREYEAARSTEKTIREALAQSKGTIQGLNRKEIELGVLEREAAANGQVYQTFLSRFKEVNATKYSQGSNARLVDSAVPALLPIRPAKARTVAIAAALSLFLGVIGSLLLKVLNNTVKTSGDVEAKLHQPFLAALPVVPGKAKQNVARAVLDHPYGPFAESIRTASTGVLLSALDTPRKIVVVTSSVREEGKSTFAMNLAFSQAKAKRVLLIEGDMRRPCFAKLMNLSGEQKGLSQLLSGACTFEECLLQVDGTFVIPAGRIPPNPLELLASQEFRDLLAMLRDRCDMVIIDSPPVQLVSDALVIGSQSTGLIYVVTANKTPAPLARAGLKRIASANIPIFGVVLNAQDFKKAERYYGDYSSVSSAVYCLPPSQTPTKSRRFRAVATSLLRRTFGHWRTKQAWNIKKP